MKQLACILLVLAVVGCRRFEEPLFGRGEVARNSLIGKFRTDADGEARIVEADIVVAGRVVSSDREGNFFNTFIIDDGTGAVEIMAGMYDLDATYHPGQLIEVRARGLAVGFRDGVMQIGLPPRVGSSYATEYFAHPLVIGRYVFPAHDVALTEPLDVSIEELTTALCGRLVRLDGLALDPLETATTWAITEPVPRTAEVKFRTAQTEPVASTDSISVLTSGYAGFAAASLPDPDSAPEQKISLTGILLYGKGDSSRDHFMLKLRSLEDVE